jgi:hypothetical protein
MPILTYTREAGERRVPSLAAVGARRRRSSEERRAGFAILLGRELRRACIERMH